MPQLLIAIEPGVFVMAEAVLAAGEPGSDENFVKIAQNGKFAAVRCEAFNMGYYADGGQPPAPVSPVDGAQLDAEELLWIPILASNSAPDAGFEPQQLDFPSLAPYTLGRLLINPLEHYFDPVAGQMVSSIYAFDSGRTNSQVYRWGVTLLFCISQRLSIQYVQPGALASTASAASGGASVGAGGAGVSGPTFAGDLSGDADSQEVIGIQGAVIDGGPTDADALVYSSGSGKWEPTRVAKASEVQQESLIYAADSGTANAYAVTLAPAPTVVAGSIVVFMAANANTGASTLAVNGGSPVAIKKAVTTALASGDILANQIVALIFDGTNFQMLGGAGSGGGSFTAAGDLSGDSSSQEVIGIQGKAIDGGPTNGDLLVYSSGTGMWEPISAASFAPASRNINTTAPLTGGGDLSTDRTLSILSPSDATKFLNGAATPAFAQVKDSDLSTSDVTTNDVSATKHGFAPKGPNVATEYLDGTGAYSTPAGSGSPVRGTVALDAGTIAAGASATGSTNLGKSAVLVKVVSAYKCRLRLYSTGAGRDSDAGRAVGVLAAWDSGLLVELVLDTSALLTFTMQPPALLENLDGSVSPAIYYNVASMETASHDFTFTFTRLLLEN